MTTTTTGTAAPPVADPADYAVTILRAPSGEVETIRVAVRGAEHPQDETVALYQGDDEIGPYLARARDLASSDPHTGELPPDTALIEQGLLDAGFALRESWRDVQIVIALADGVDPYIGPAGIAYDANGHDAAAMDAICSVAIGLADVRYCGGGAVPLCSVTRAPAPNEMLAALREARDAISSLVHQVEQMRGLFDDADGAIQSALDDAALADASAAAAIARAEGR